MKQIHCDRYQVLSDFQLVWGKYISHGIAKTLATDQCMGLNAVAGGVGHGISLQYGCKRQSHILQQSPIDNRLEHVYSIPKHFYRDIKNKQLTPRIREFMLHEMSQHDNNKIIIVIFKDEK